MTQSPEFPRIRTVGLSGLLISFGGAMSEPANRAALAFRAAVEAAGVATDGGVHLALVELDLRAPEGIAVLERLLAGAREIARCSRGTPRISNRLLRRVRDYAQVKADGVINAEIAAAALELLHVDHSGFDIMDRRLLQAIIEKFDGGPVGVENLAAAIGEERDTIEDVIEPYLIQQGYLMRTPRGRVATATVYRLFGLKPPASMNQEQVTLDLIQDK